jgi:hypothetical protein
VQRGLLYRDLDKPPVLQCTCGLCDVVQEYSQDEARIPFWGHEKTAGACHIGSTERLINLISSQIGSTAEVRQCSPCSSTLLSRLNIDKSDLLSSPFIQPSDFRGTQHHVPNTIVIETRFRGADVASTCVVTYQSSKAHPELLGRTPCGTHRSTQHITQWISYPLSKPSSETSCTPSWTVANPCFELDVSCDLSPCLEPHP